MHPLLFLAATFAALFAPLLGAWRWAIAHQVEIVGTAVAVIVLCRAVPADRWQRLERNWPRVAATARFLRALFPDILKAAKAIFAIWTGRPWPFGDPPADAGGGPTAPYRAAPAPAPAPPRAPPMAAMAGLGALVLGVAMVLTVGALLGGCAWHNAPADCTTPGAYQCVGNVPMRCMTGDRVLRPIHDPCAPGEVCAVVPGILAPALATCVPADGGSDAATH